MEISKPFRVSTRTVTVLFPERIRTRGFGAEMIKDIYHSLTRNGFGFADAEEPAVNVPDECPMTDDDIPDIGALFKVNRVNLDTLRSITKRFPKNKFKRLAEMLKANFTTVEKISSAGLLGESNDLLNRIAVHILARTLSENVTMPDLVRGM